MGENFKPVENYVDLNRQDILWYEIPGYRGYEISNTGLVRSLKHFRKYPFGILIEKQGKDSYILSNSDNKRIKVSMSEIMDRVSKDPNKYGKHTCQRNPFSRNPKEFVNRESEPFDPTPKPFRYNL